MATYRTALQQMRSGRDYADLANCATLKHLLVPIGKQSTLIDYIAGVHKTSFFTGNEDLYGIPGTTAPDTAVTGGNWVDFSTNNFIALLVGYFDNALTNFQIGTAVSNHVLFSSNSAIAGAGATASFSSNANVSEVQGRAIIRSGLSASSIEIEGVEVDVATQTLGAVTPADTIGSLFIDQFYGCAVFVFSGALPSNYAAVIAEITADFKAGNYRIPKAVEDWA